MDESQPLPLDERRTGAHAAAGSRLGDAARWLKGTLHGLTWQRYGIFCLVVLTYALTRPWTTQLLLNPSVERALSGTARAFLFGLLNFTPVLLAVVAVENRGPSRGGKRIAALAAALVVGSLVGALLYATVAGWIDPARFAKSSWADDPLAWIRRRIGVMLADCVISVPAVAFWYFFRRDLDSAKSLAREQIDQVAIERETAEARLQVMRAQIEPHFLFNTLASIRRLYETDKAGGRSMLQHLSRYLTASLPILRENRSTLGRELALTVAYLNVQKIRMGARLAVDVDVPSTLHAVEVPPMMLATLVENAVNHGLGTLPAGGRIRITARVDAGRLLVEVADTGRGLRDAWGVGVGLANIRARLASQYGTAAELGLVDNEPNPGVTATLKLPLDRGRGPVAA